MKIRPLRDNLVVQASGLEEKTKSSIILPDTATKEKPEQGKVISVGSKVKSVKRGDMVIFTQYAPNEIKVGNKELLVIKEEDILAVIEK